MADQQEQEFIRLMNENMGIAHKVASIYYPDMNDREDIIQEMMYQLWKAFPGFAGLSKFSTWMYRVCLNTVLSFKRKESRRIPLSFTPYQEEIASRDEPDKKEEIKLLLKAIGTLSPLNKAIILLYLEDISYDEIAVITGLTKSNVGVRLVRIKKELEEKLSTNIKSVDNVT